MIKYLSEKMAGYIVRNDPSADFEVLAYGYDLFLQEAAVIIITLLISLPFGLPLHVLIALVTYKLMRRYTGGAHAKHRIACIVTSVLVIYGPALFFSKTGLYLPAAAMLLLYGMDVLLLLLYAPADTDIRPIQSQKERKRMKAGSILFLSVCVCAALLLRMRFPAHASILVIIPTIVSVFTHPWIYRLYGCEKSQPMPETVQ